MSLFKVYRLIYNKLIYGYNNISEPLTDLKFFQSRPTVAREILKHWNQPLETTVPMSEEEDEGDEVEYSNELSRHWDELQLFYFIYIN